MPRLLLALLVLGAVPAAAQSGLDPKMRVALRVEIADMMALDQRVRYMNTVGTFDGAYADSVGRVLAALPFEEHVAASDSLRTAAAERLTDAERSALRQIMWDADLANITRLREIVDAYGWPDSARIGGSANPFILLLHTSPDTLEAFLPALQAEVRAGRMPAVHYAMAVDKSRKIRGEHQLYGTGDEYDPATGAVAPPRVDDIEATNAARAAIGLEPLEAYRLADASTH